MLTELAVCTAKAVKTSALGQIPIFLIMTDPLTCLVFFTHSKGSCFSELHKIVQMNKFLTKPQAAVIL